MNLDDLDREVRDSLHAHAQEAPDGAGTLDAVRTRSHRLRVRHRAGVAGIAAAVAVAVAVGTPYVLTAARHTGHALNPAAQGATTTTPTITATSPPAATNAPVPDRASRVALGAPAFTPVAFPMNPTFTPAGLPKPTEGKTVGQVRLVYSSANSNKFLMASVNDTTVPVDASGATHKSTTVSGHPATIYTGNIDGQPGGVLIEWKLHGKWVAVQAHGLTSSQVKQYANGLVERPHRPGALTFKLALAPHGYQVAFQEFDAEPTGTETVFLLSAPDQLGDQSTDDAVGLNIRPSLEKEATGTAITVGGYPAKINEDAGQVTVYVLRPDFVYAVHEPVNGPLSNADLIRVAAGVSPTS
ncbi:MAG TPA: hypothetical protein VFR11_18655 [Micromonosporaceae bacterium]|jgi:hypothetical protein|nr:hypothetical protein [Micromonosporaceae bacterium]